MNLPQLMNALPGARGNALPGPRGNALPPLRKPSRTLPRLPSPFKRKKKRASTVTPLTHRIEDYHQEGLLHHHGGSVSDLSSESDSCQAEKRRASVVKAFLTGEVDLGVKEYMPGFAMKRFR